MKKFLIAIKFHILKLKVYGYEGYNFGAGIYPRSCPGVKSQTLFSVILHDRGLGSHATSDVIEYDAAT